jgi:hypothetical protein
MSQERTRFPIQPKERRRSSQSDKDVAVKGTEHPRADRAHADKPQVPPHRRKGRDKTTED